MIETQEKRVFQPGELITSYAGYMRRGLTLEDAKLAATRYHGEFPGQTIDLIEFEPGKFAAMVYAAEVYELPLIVEEEQP